MLDQIQVQCLARGVRETVCTLRCVSLGGTSRLSVPLSDVRIGQWVQGLSA